MKNRNKIGFSIVGFLLFFLTIAVTSGCSILVFHFANMASSGNVYVIMFSVFGIILIGALFCSGVDIIRRRKMVENPVNKILDATEKIASGNFNVKLTPEHEYDKYDEYDLIFENINTMTSELSKNEVLKNDFISNVSHEIKTPLAVIQNYAKTLQKSNLDNSQKEECLKGLIDQTNKLSNLISNILKLNKLENQELIPEMKEVDLAEFVRVTTLQYEPLFEKKNIELECDIDEVKLESNTSMLEIILNNLISNAIKFTDENGKITICLKTDKTHIILKVQDTGCGISKEVGEHIFDKFYQGDTSHASEGNGLGLALVKRVIDLIGGEISVESKVDKGSTFIIKLKRE